MHFVRNYATLVHVHRSHGLGSFKLFWNLIKHGGRYTRFQTGIVIRYECGLLRAISNTDAHYNCLGKRRKFILPNFKICVQRLLAVFHSKLTVLHLRCCSIYDEGCSAAAAILAEASCQTYHWASWCCTAPCATALTRPSPDIWLDHAQLGLKRKLQVSQNCARATILTKYLYNIKGTSYMYL